MSLRSRIVLVVAAVFAGVSAASGWLMLSRAEGSLQTAFDRATRTRAAWLLSQVGTDPVVVPLPAADERMRLQTDTDGDRRELFRSPGFPADTDPEAGLDSGISETENTDFQHIDKLTVDQPATGPDQRHRQHPAHFWRSYRAVTVKTVPDDGAGTHVWLTLAVPDAGLRQDIGRLRWTFGLGWLLSLGLALVAGYGAAGWLLRPIRAMVSQADQIGNATRIDPLILPRSHDELYTLTLALNRMLDRIRDTINTQRHFFGAAAHELRTPLAVMKTGFDVTLGSNRVGPDLRPFLQSQRDEVSRLSRLLDEFLTLSRPDDAPARLTLTSVILPDLLRDCIDRLAPVALDYEVTLALVPPDAPVAGLLTDAVKLEHILMNLLENAIKYAVTGSVITAQLIQQEGITIQIDNQTDRAGGPVQDLLQPYFRADPLGDGHGLGLWISHRLTELLGGQLRLTWQAFRFTAEVQFPVAG